MQTFSRLVTASAVLALVAAMVLAGLLVTAPGARATHETVQWFPGGVVSSATGFDRFAPVAVTDGTTSLYVFYYTTKTSTGASNINVTKVSLGTGFLGLPETLFDKQVNDVSNVVYDGYPMSAVLDRDGNVYVAWARNPMPGLNTEVYVSKSSDGGVTWDPAVRANAPNAAGQDFMPSIVAAPDGTVYVAWLQIWGIFFNITVSQSTNGGSTFTTHTNASGQFPGSIAAYPSLSIDSAGRLYLAYMGAPSTPGLGFHLNVTRSDDGSSWTAPSQLTPDSVYPSPPGNLVDASGRVHLVWTDFRGLLTSGMFTEWQSMSLDRGVSWLPGTPISQGVNPPYLGSPSAISNHIDEIMVVWPSVTGFDWVVSADGGFTWTPEASVSLGYVALYPTVVADQNATFYAAVTDTSGSYASISALMWLGPPTAPAITSVAVGTGSLTVTWAASPEPNVASYQVYRSTNGVDFTQITTVGATTTSYQDTGLADGTYWYEVVAVNEWGTASHASAAWSATLGPSLASLQDRINQLQSQLNAANADLADIQTQLNALKGQLTGLQGNTSALQDQVNALQEQLNNLQSQQATQTMAYANLAFEIIVVVLLIALLLMQLRKPKGPRMMMAESSNPAPKKPEDEL